MTLMKVFGHLLGPSFLDFAQAFLENYYVFLHISCWGINLISIELIALMAYLGS
jgi:hypothetical protein